MKAVLKNPSLIGVVVFALLLAAGVAIASRGGTYTVRADFENPLGVYVGNPVTLLGVQVGKVTDLDPDGTVVHVTMEIQDDIDLPAGARAAILQQSLVNSRAIAFTPAYSSGPKLADGARLGVDKTFAPVELDEILSALQKLSVSLGPHGANAQGAVNEFLKAGAEALGGQGPQANRTLRQLANVLSTVDDNRSDLAAVVTNLADVLDTLARSNATVTGFERDLAGASAVLADERESFAAVTRELGVALGQLASLIKDHRDDLGQDVQSLATISTTLVARQKELMETLDVLPLGLANVKNAINPGGALDIRVPAADFAPALCVGILGNQLPGAGTVLNLLEGLPGVGTLTQTGCQQLLTAILPLTNGLGVLSADELLGELTRLLDGLPLASKSARASTPTSTTRATTPARAPATTPDVGLSGLLSLMGGS